MESVDWPTVISAVSTLVAAVALWRLARKDNREEDRADEAKSVLDAAAIVSATFSTTHTTAEFLRNLFVQCTAECTALRLDLDVAKQAIHERDNKIEQLNATVAEHEATITKHERALSQVARREDMQPPPEEGTDG